MPTTIDNAARPVRRSSMARILPRLRRRLVLGAGAAFLLGLPASAGAVPARMPATQQLAVLLTAHRAHQAPDAGSPQAMLVAARRPITGEQTTLPVLAGATDAHGVRWLRVLLPGRPNGASGWIAQQATRRLVTGWRLVVDLVARRVRVYRDGHILRSFDAVVGKSSTPTPTGQFFVEETVQLPVGEVGGPFALALSARSDALQEFEGGPGQIALHGRDNLGGVLGSAESHGCVRLATSSIDWLAARIGPGTPTTIYGG
jgi:lipoprotein-anchoring transpeptidase ErfK/SrfK